MAKGPSVEEAVERARRVQDDRIKSIEAVARTRQNVSDVRDDTGRELAELQAQIAERVNEAERADVKAFNAALSAGWTVDELKKIGFGEPEKKTRARRKTARRGPTKQPAAPTSETHTQNARHAGQSAQSDTSEAA